MNPLIELIHEFTRDDSDDRSYLTKGQVRETQQEHQNYGLCLGLVWGAAGMGLVWLLVGWFWGTVQ